MLPNDPIELDEGDDSPASGGSRMVYWLIILGLGLLFLPLYLIATTIKDSSAELQTELDGLQATLAFTPPANPSEEALTSTLVFVRLEMAALESLQGTLVGMHINWPSVMAVIAAYEPVHMVINAVTQTGIAITIGGQADDPSVVSTYAEMLRTSGLFEEVAVGLINIEILPTPTPTPPTDAAAEATAEPTTIFEPQSVANFEITVVVKMEAP